MEAPLNHLQFVKLVVINFRIYPLCGDNGILAKLQQKGGMRKNSDVH